MNIDDLKRVGSSLLALTLAVSITVQAGSVNAAALQTNDNMSAKEIPIAASQPPIQSTTQNSGVASGKKNETVYVTLDSSGKPTETIVSVWLHNNDPKNIVVDRTNLSDINVLKGGQMTNKKDNSVTWTMNEPDLYYQGTSSQPLPLDIDIKYRLDGKEYPAAEIAGKSGHLEILIKLHNQQKQNIILNGKSTEMCAPLTVIMGAVLPEEIFTNVNVTDGKVISDGGKQAVLMVSMPGMSESLNMNQYDIPGVKDITIPEQFTISADVVNFEMDPIMAAVSVGFPEVETDTTELNDMLQDLQDLKKMQTNISSSDPNRQIHSIFTNASMTTGAQTLVKDIDRFYDLNLHFLTSLTKYVNKDNVELIDSVRNHLHNKDGIGYGIDVMKVLYSKTPEALVTFTQNVDIDSATQLVQDLKMLKAYTSQYQDLLQDPAAKEVLHSAAELGLTATSHLQQTAALAGAATNLTPELVGGMLQDYQLSGLAGFSDSDWNTFIMGGLKAVGMSSVGVSSIDPEKIQRLLVTTKTIKNHTAILLEDEYGIDVRDPRQVNALLSTGHQLSIDASNTTQAMLAVAANPQAAQQLQQLIGDINSGKIDALKAKLSADIELNSTNIELLQELISSPDVDLGALRGGLRHMDMMLDDIRAIMSIVQDLDSELDDASNYLGFIKSPHTVKALMSMKDDLFKYRNVTDALRETVKPQTIAAFSDVFTTLDRLEADDAVNRYINQVSEITELFDKKEIFTQLSKQNTTFTGVPDNYDSELKFVIKTAEIKAPVEESTVATPVPAQSSKNKFFSWAKKLKRS